MNSKGHLIVNFFQAITLSKVTAMTVCMALVLGEGNNDSRFITIIWLDC